jgi:spore protease
MRKRNLTDMIDERGNNLFVLQKYDYDIIKNKSKSKKQVVINVPLINVYGRKIQDYLINLLKEEFVNTFKIRKYQNICVVGLGNREVINDALGPKVLQKLLITRGLDIKPQLSVIYPNVYAQTGIESADLILSVCKEIKPDLVIFIDSLATTALTRLCSSFQLTNEGIQAGSALNAKNKKITSKNLGCNIISVGVPMMIYAKNFLNKKLDNLGEIILSPCDTKKVLNLISDIIADSINSSVFPQYTKQEIEIMKN